MAWIIIIMLLLLVLLLVLLTPVELHVDTRIPAATVRWINIGKVIIVYEKEDWWLKMQVLFFHKTWALSDLILKSRKKKKRAKPEQKSIQKKQRKKRFRLSKIVKVVPTFRIIEWEAAIDTGSMDKNARLYPLNFLPLTYKHVYVNFIEENYFLLSVRNTPWRIMYAYIK